VLGSNGENFLVEDPGPHQTMRTVLNTNFQQAILLAKPSATVLRPPKSVMHPHDRDIGYGDLMVKVDDDYIRALDIDGAIDDSEVLVTNNVMGMPAVPPSIGIDESTFEALSDAEKEEVLLSRLTFIGGSMEHKERTGLPVNGIPTTDEDVEGIRVQRTGKLTGVYPIDKDLAVGDRVRLAIAPTIETTIPLFSGTVAPHNALTIRKIKDSDGLGAVTSSLKMLKARLGTDTGVNYTPARFDAAMTSGSVSRVEADSTKAAYATARGFLSAAAAISALFESDDQIGRQGNGNDNANTVANRIARFLTSNDASPGNMARIIDAILGAGTDPAFNGAMNACSLTYAGFAGGLATQRAIGVVNTIDSDTASEHGTRVVIHLTNP